MTDGTYANYNLRSILGFFSGVLLTHIVFAFFLITGLDITLATYICAILAPILSLGLALSTTFRCMTLLIVPQMFSKQGRQVLLAYAFVLAATGPGRNIFHNMNILSDSMACTQEQLSTAMKNIKELITVPFKSLNAAMKRVMESLKRIVKKIKDMLLSIKRLVLALMSTLKKAFDWLTSAINFCNKKLGTPYERCMKVLNEACDDCKVQVSDVLNWMCSISYAGAPVCYSVKWIDYLCDFVDWVVNSETIFGVIRRKMREFGRHLKTLFYVSISVKHSYSFETNQSKSYDEVTRGILGDIKERSQWFTNLVEWFSTSSVCLMFTFFMMYQLLMYRFRFLNSDSFDNRYITEDLEEIDWRRTLMDKETILPLNRREKNKYVSVFSTRMIPIERRMFARSALFLSISSVKLIIYMVLDYSLYWLLSIVKKYGRVQTNTQDINPLTLHVDGDGIVASILKSVINSFKFVGAVIDIDTISCLPDPIPPNVDQYEEILLIILVMWIITFFQPFGMRLRHYFMSLYHPDIAKQRAVWLYNQILRKRSSFVKHMRRELRRKFSTSTNALSAQNSTIITFKQRLLALLPFLSYLIKDEVNKRACLVCGSFQTEGIKLKFCPTPGCIGTYCEECFAQLDNICTVCKNPVEYGDMSDISEEKDSSEDEQKKREKQNKKKMRKKKLINKRNRIFNWKSKKDKVLSVYELINNDSSSSESEHQRDYKIPVATPKSFYLTPKDIFSQPLPLCNIQWSGNKNENLLDTSDNALVKYYARNYIEPSSSRNSATIDMTNLKIQEAESSWHTSDSDDSKKLLI